MGLNFGKIGSLLSKVSLGLVKAVSHVEILTTTIGVLKTLKGQQKQDMAIELGMEGLAAVEDLLGKNFADDEELRDLAKIVVNAVVAFENRLAEKTAELNTD